jgi:hypothetical protein
MNDTWQQAGLTFVLNTQKSGPKDVHYDLNLDGMLPGLQANNEQNVLETTPALTAPGSVKQPNGTGAKLNVIILAGCLVQDKIKILNNPTQPIGICGFTPTNGDEGVLNSQIFALLKPCGNLSIPDYKATFINNFSHEAGHAFGLATRNGWIPSEGKRGGDHFHDNGRFPHDGMRRFGGMVPSTGLMYWQPGSSQWMRHEDWQRSNDLAQPFGAIGSDE